MVLAHIVMLAAGLAILGVGGEVLVRGASRLARQFGVSALVVGLTVVAFGTSAPEVAVTLDAGARGEHEIAVANVVGSCTINLLIVLGIAAIAYPLRVSRNVVRTDLPVMIGVLALFLLFAVNGHTIERWMGIVFLIMLAMYTVSTIRNSRRASTDVSDEFETGLPPGRSAMLNIGLIVGGLIALAGGAELMIIGAVGIAEQMGISKRVIGLTIVALGTSLPEIATCVAAARRRQPDIAIGNVVGSNIFNILAVLGVTTTFFPLSVSDQTIFVDGPMMLFAALLAFPILRTGHRVSRLEGGLLLSVYACYLGGILMWVN